MELPESLRAALEDELSSLAPKRVAALTAALSQRYRSAASNLATSTGSSFVPSPGDVAAYAAYRIPATFAAVAAVLKEVRERLPGWEPRSLLDAGAGPGTVAWAAAAVWPGLAKATLVERESGMIALGRRLAARAASDLVRDATWLQVDLTGSWPDVSPHDLVVLSYVLGEIQPGRAEALVNQLWEMTGGALILVEPGTQSGHARIRQAREWLAGAVIGATVVGATVIAPCPHGGPCPMGADDWCHFAQRVARSRLHRQAKGGELSYEDEKFSYVAVSRPGLPAAPVRARVLRHPQVRSGHIRLELCSATGGLTSEIVTRKDRERFKEARDLRWGSGIQWSEAGW